MTLITLFSFFLDTLLEEDLVESARDDATRVG